jgi:hypothetical protein
MGGPPTRRARAVCVAPSSRSWTAWPLQCRGLPCHRCRMGKRPCWAAGSSRRGGAPRPDGAVLGHGPNGARAGSVEPARTQQRRMLTGKILPGRRIQLGELRAAFGPPATLLPRSRRAIRDSTAVLAARVPGPGGHGLRGLGCARHRDLLTPGWSLLERRSEAVSLLATASWQWDVLASMRLSRLQCTGARTGCARELAAPDAAGGPYALLYPFAGGERSSLPQGVPVRDGAISGRPRGGAPGWFSGLDGQSAW